MARSRLLWGQMSALNKSPPVRPSFVALVTLIVVVLRRKVKCETWWFQMVSNDKICTVTKDWGTKSTRGRDLWKFWQGGVIWLIPTPQLRGDFKKEDKGGWLRHLTQHSLSLEDKRLRTIQREVRMLKLTWRSFLSLPYHPMSCFVPFQFPFAFPCLQIFLNFWILYQIHVLFSVCLFYWWTRSDCFISPVSDLGWLYLIAQLNWFSIVFIRPVPDQGWLNLCIRWVRSIAHSWKCLIC